MWVVDHGLHQLRFFNEGYLSNEYLYAEHELHDKTAETVFTDSGGSTITSSATRSGAKQSGLGQAAVESRCISYQRSDAAEL